MLKKVLHSSLLRSSAVYTLSSVANAAVPFLIMPVLTRYLTPEDYGITSMLSVIVGIVSPFIGLNVHGAVSVKYYELKADELSRYIGNCFLLLIGSTITVTALFLFFAGPISVATAIPRKWLPTVIILCVGQFVSLVLLTLWQVQGNSFRFGAFQVMQTVVNMALTIILIVVLHMDWRGRVMAQTISIVLFAIIAMIFIHRSGMARLSFDRNHLHHALKFGVPLIPHALGSMLITQTDRIFITNMVGIRDTGIYTVGFQIGMIIELLASSFNRAYVPWLFPLLSENDPAKKRHIVKLTYWYFLGILLLALAIALIAPWFLSFFVGKEFSGASVYTVWIAVGFAFSGMYYMIANYIFFAGATHLLAIVTFLTAMMNIVFNYVLIKLNGAVGAAQASATAFLVSFLLTWALSAKVYPMPWKIWKLQV